MQQTTCPNCGEVVNVLPGDINGNMQLDAHTRPAMAGNVQCTGSFRLIGRRDPQSPRYWWTTPDALDEQARTSARSLAALAEMVRAWTTDGLGAPNAETLSTLAVAIQSHADGLLAALPPES